MIEDGGEPGGDTWGPSLRSFKTLASSSSDRLSLFNSSNKARISGEPDAAFWLSTFFCASTADVSPAEIFLLSSFASNISVSKSSVERDESLINLAFRLVTSNPKEAWSEIDEE